MTYETKYAGAHELTDGTYVSAVDGLTELSPDGTLKVRIMTDSDTGRYFYTAAKNGKTILQASQIGLNADEDYTQGLVYAAGSRKSESGTEAYALTSGARAEVIDPYREMSFELGKDGRASKRIRVTFRLFNGGIAYRYTLYGQAGEKVSISGEASEYVLSAGAAVWAGDTDVNYEFDFTKRSMSAVKDMSGSLSVPLLANDGELWVLISEGAVYNDPDPYCASLLSTRSGSGNLQVKFGNGQTHAVEKTFRADGTVSTPWRVAAIADNLNDIVNATIFTSVNPDPDPELYGDLSYIRPGKAAWSWWSEAGDDPVEYNQQKDYIDFAAENGWEYVCVDFGWCLWEDYRAKVKELVEYAGARGVGIMLWYGVNNDNHAGFRDASGNPAYPKYSLKTTEQLEEQFAWCREAGVKAVKVDYYESDNQFTMRQMYECAAIAAKNRINVLFHGCTVPRGEQRTFPNVLGYEAVRGAEWYKWNVGPTVASCLTYIFTRNALGGMDYTPPAMKIGQFNTTAGFQLAQAAAYESGLPSIASSVFKLEGFEGLALLNDLPVTWDETVLADGYPGEHLAVARRSGGDWYLAVMTAAAREENIGLSFLGGGEYRAYIFRDNADGSGIMTEEISVTREDRLQVKLLTNGGMTVKFTKNEMSLATAYDAYDYYEAEDEANELTGSAAVVENQFASGMKRVGGIGLGRENALTFTGVTAPEDGVYELRLYYYTGTERRIFISVNGREAIRTGKLNCGVNALSAESYYIKLKAGVNTVTFSNPGAKAPDVDRIAVSKTPTDREPTATDGTELEKGVSAIEVTHHGRTVCGDAYIPDAEEFPLVIFSHGYNGCKDDFRSDAAFLLDEGVASITFTFCGGGAGDRSGFATTQMTLFTEREDLEALMDYASSIKGFNGKLYLFGGSQGGMVSAMAAQTRPEDIAGLVLIFPAFSIPDDWSSRYPKSQFPNPEDIPETIPWWGVELGRDFAATARDFSIYDKMAEFTKPVMIFHGTADSIIPVSCSKRASEIYPNCCYKTYPGAGHGFAPNLMAETDNCLLELIRTGNFPGRGPEKVQYNPPAAPLPPGYSRIYGA